jgi:hypothetical protein
VAPVGSEVTEMGPNGPETCTNGRCVNVAGTTQQNLLDSTIAFPKNGSGLGQPGGYTVYGVDPRDASLGPLGSASLVSGHWFTTAEADSYAAIVDSGYAKSRSLKLGSPVTIGQARYTVVGIVSQPQGSSPPGVCIPLAWAQAMPLIDGNLRGGVNTIYLTAASAADIPAVSKEISRLLPDTTVTTASTLASQVTGSLVSAARLADDLGRWLEVLVAQLLRGWSDLYSGGGPTTYTPWIWAGAS